MFVTHYIKNRFGSKRGLLNAVTYSIRSLLGFYKKHQAVSLSKSTRFIFICSGNICRSPLAEYVAKQQGAQAISFGLHTRGGDPARGSLHRPELRNDPWPFDNANRPPPISFGRKSSERNRRELP